MEVPSRGKAKVGINAVHRSLPRRQGRQNRRDFKKRFAAKAHPGESNASDGSSCIRPAR